MNKLLAALMCCLVASTALAQVKVTGSDHVRPLPDDSLYQAFGGQSGLTKLTADLVPRLKADARIGPMFKDIKSAELQKQLADQFCVVSGGPCRYEGESMKNSHADLDIHKADFNRLVELLQQAMDAQGIPFTAQNRLLAQLAPMHRDVIKAN